MSSKTVPTLLTTRAAVPTDRPTTPTATATADAFDPATLFVRGNALSGMEWTLFATLAETAGDSEVTVDVDAPATVGDALDALVAAHPDLEDEVLDEEGSVQDHIRLLHEGRDPFVEADGLETTVEDGDELALFPPVSGG
jgi:molybdopterin synthase sulfur carrier subunit